MQRAKEPSSPSEDCAGLAKTKQSSNHDEGARRMLAAPAPFHEIAVEAGYFLLIAVLIYLLHPSNLLDSDEGVILNGAWNLLNGQRLYLDFFEYVPPGAFYTIYATWALTGAHYWAAQLVGIGFLLFGAAGVQLIASEIMRSARLEAPAWSIRITPLLFSVFSATWPLINHNTFSTVTAIWATYFLLKSIRSDSARYTLVAGSLAGVASVFLQHRGLAVVAGATTTYALMWYGSRQAVILKLVILFALASAIAPALMMALFPPATLYYDLFIFPTLNYARVNSVNPAPLLIALGLLVTTSWYLRRDCNRLVLLLILIQAALLLSTVPRPDLGHVLAVIFPLLCLLPLAVARFVSERPASILKTSSAPLWMSAVIFTAGSAVRLLVFAADTEPRLFSFIRENCASSPYLYAGPFTPGLYFATEKQNATRYSVLLTGLNTNAQFEDAATSLSHLDVPCAVTNYALAQKFGYTENNAVDRYLRDNYQVAFVDGDFQVLRRRTRPSVPSE